MSFSDTINATTINASKFYKDGEEINHSHIASGDITASEIKLSDGTNETLLTPFTSQDGNIYGLKINPLYDNENGVNIVNNNSNSSINVGIGITNPIYPLDIGIGDNSIPSGNGYIYYYEGPFGKQNQEDTTKKIAVRCDGRYYLGAGYVAYSDSRIKENIRDVPDDLSLQTLRDISCNYYEYKDKKSRGIEKTIGFIAQQVKEKMPMAVTLQRDWIPNEMRIIKNPSWEELPDNKFKLTITDLENVSGNTKYKFYMSNDVSGNDEIMKESKTLENDTKSFVFDRSWNNVFLYGKEVNDVHALDKQKLFTLNFSATQEIDKIQQKHKQEIAELNNKVISLQNQLESVLKRLDALETN